MLASSNGHPEVVKVLLENKADVKARNEWGLSSLFFASVKQNDAVVQLLLEHIALVDGEPLSIVSCQLGCQEQEQFLAEVGAKKYAARDIFSSFTSSGSDIVLEAGANITYLSHKYLSLMNPTTKIIHRRISPSRPKATSGIPQ